MMGIFSDMIELILEISMDDFSVFGDSYEGCLENLREVLERCQEKNLVLNWEKNSLHGDTRDCPRPHSIKKRNRGGQG